MSEWYKESYPEYRRPMFWLPKVALCVATVWLAFCAGCTKAPLEPGAYHPKLRVYGEAPLTPAETQLSWALDGVACYTFGVAGIDSLHFNWNAVRWATADSLETWKDDGSGGGEWDKRTVAVTLYRKGRIYVWFEKPGAVDAVTAWRHEAIHVALYQSGYMTEGHHIPMHFTCEKEGV